MNFDKLPQFPRPERIVIKDTEGETRAPYERIKGYDDKEFELFIREWVTSLSNRYDVKGFGGAGDKGRDVVARDNDGNLFYYQCKHYDHALMPSDMLPEFGKLIYYTYTKEIAIPKEYYILAPHDIGPRLSDLITNHSKINSKLVAEWDSSCKQKIRSVEIPLTEDLKDYIEKFDFSIIKTKTMLEVVEEHQKTAFCAFRFGGGLTIHRDTKTIIPKSVDEFESTYIAKYLEAISEKEGCTINSIEQLEKEWPRYFNNLKVQRERFYSAENLKLFAAENLLSEEYFVALCNDIFFGVFDLFEKDYNFGWDRMLDVLSHVVTIDLNHNLLSKYDLVRPQDRQGVCHQLANERGEITWVRKK